MSEENLSEVVVPTVSVDEEAPRSDSFPVLQYDRNAMLKLYHSPLSKVRPDYLSEEFDRVISDEPENGDAPAKLWGPDLWIESIWRKENGNSANSRQNRQGVGNVGGGQRSTNGGASAENSQRRRQGVDRLKAESKDGIVLSPQRRSFGAGCQAPAAVSSASSANSSSQNCSAYGNSSQRRSASPDQENLVGSASSSSHQQQTAPKNKLRSSFSTSASSGRGGGRPDDRGGSAGPPPPPSQYHGGGSRGDRVTNWRDKNHYGHDNRDFQNRDRRPNNMGYYSNYRHNNDELPEWATDGPSDMHETIELHGFDDDLKKSPPDSSPISSNSNSNKNSSSADVTDRRKMPVADAETHYNGGAPPNEQSPHAEAPSSSRFSKFFAKTNVDKSDKQKSAFSANADELYNKESRKPTNPNLNTAVANQNLLELLTKAKINVVQQKPKEAPTPPTSSASSAAGKIPAGAMNLEDLEAILCKKKSPIAAAEKPPKAEQNSADASGKQFLEDLFKSASSGGQQQLPKPLQLPTQVQQQPQETSSAAVGNVISVPVVAEAPPILPNAPRPTKLQMAKGNPLADPNQQQHLMEALQKLQVQQQQLQDSANVGISQPRHSAPFGVPQSANSANSAYLQAIFGAPPKDAVLANILHHQQQSAAAAAAVAAAPQPPGGATVSQQELLMNAQMVYQKALLNRKLEEQKENFVKRQQEISSADVSATSAISATSSISATPPIGKYSAFLPTSVLKQMGKSSSAAAREIQPSSSSAADSALGGGRPIVKQQQILTPQPPPPPQVQQQSPQDFVRFMQQQQQAAQQMQLLRLQQLQMLQQLSAAGGLPRPAANNKPVSNEEYQQMVAMALLQQQQQQQQQQQHQQQQQIRAAAVAAGGNVPAVGDLLRQRAMLVAAAAQQQQQQQQISFRPPSFAAAGQAQQTPTDNNLRNFFQTGNFFASSTSPVYPPMPGATTAKSMTLDELERLQKQNSAAPNAMN